MIASLLHQQRLIETHSEDYTPPERERQGVIACAANRAAQGIPPSCDMTPEANEQYWQLVELIPDTEWAAFHREIAVLALADGRRCALLRHVQAAWEARSLVVAAKAEWREKYPELGNIKNHRPSTVLDGPSGVGGGLPYRSVVSGGSRAQRQREIDEADREAARERMAADTARHVQEHEAYCRHRGPG